MQAVCFCSKLYLACPVWSAFLFKASKLRGELEGTIDEELISFLLAVSSHESLICNSKSWALIRVLES